jgi:hypothetical protein
MEQVMDNIEKAQTAFDDLAELLDGEEGFALSQGTWQKSGWRELDELRKWVGGAAGGAGGGAAVGFIQRVQ